MTDESNRPTPRLWTEAGFRDDPWRHADEFEAGQGNSRVILPLGAWRGLDAGTRLANRERIAVELAPGDRLDEIVDALVDLPLVALAFPVFSDGRSYSKADLLRRRHGYGGEIRATGDVLIDQIPLMLRTGFDAFEVSNPTALARLEARRLGGLPVHYQPAARDAAPGAKYSWRRKPAA